MGFSWTGKKVSVSEHDDGKYYITELSSGHTIEMTKSSQRLTRHILEANLNDNETIYFQCYFCDLNIHDDPEAYV